MSRIGCFWMSRYPELTRMAWNFFKTMDYLKKHYDLAIILISHDLDYVARYADHVVLLDKTSPQAGNGKKEVYESSEFERIFSAGKEETWIKEDETND